MLLFDASHTSHSRAQTGIQKVVRSMYAALRAAGKVEPVCYDPHLNGWRVLEDWERQTLSDQTGAGSAHRSARWPFRVKASGAVRRWLGRIPPPPTGSALIVPELFSARVSHAFLSLFERISGPRVAVFHDAVAMKFPEFTPPKTVARFPTYLRELLAFDGIAAVSEDSRQTLLGYWDWFGIAHPPPVITIPNAIDLPSVSPDSSSPSSSDVEPTVLCVGSIEGRKNQLSLLCACEQLWTEGLRFKLRLIGLAHPQTGRAALEKLQSLQSAGFPVSYDGPVSNATLASAYRDCAFTVYPSLLEGFGLPVQESLAHGKPCICSAHGAIGESARGGGCLTLQNLAPHDIAAAARLWLTSPEKLDAARTETRQRTFRTWAEHASDVFAWLSDLPRRPVAP